tara:strand:- start:7378 stop:8178 length:801 start_codon:yes stop_codon:yes gene_type:complete
LFIKTEKNINPNFYYKLSDCKDEKLLLYPHLGLGDTIICNGFVNYLSLNKNRKIQLIIDEKFLNSIRYLYKFNKNVEIIPVKLDEVNNADSSVIEIYKSTGKKALKIGFSYHPGVKFYKAFYKQLNIPYRYSYKYYSQPRDYEKEEELFNHLIDYYDVDPENYNLVHSEASSNAGEKAKKIGFSENFQLKVSTNNKSIFVEKKSDIFGNLFYYNKVAENAKQIHCVNSSFCHFIDRVPTTANLYYHNVRGSKLDLKKDWEGVNYGD